MMICSEMLGDIQIYREIERDMGRYADTRSHVGIIWSYMEIQSDIGTYQVAIESNGRYTLMRVNCWKAYKDTVMLMGNIGRYW